MPPQLMSCAAGNFRRGRPAGLLPQAVVLHRSGGSRDTFRARFNDPSASVSAHYVVGRDGTVDQYVLDGDTAFHAGIADGATWRLLRPGVNPNFYTIGVELEGPAEGDWPDAQINAAAGLIAEICRRWTIAIDADHVVQHSAIRASSRCAVDCPIDRIVAAAAAADPAVRVPRRRIVRTVSPANVRDGAPSRQARIVRVIASGTDVVVEGFTNSGEPVAGNASWYVDSQGQFLWAGATDIPNPADDDAAAAIASTSGTTDAMDLADGSLVAALDAAVPDARIDRTTMALPPTQFVDEITKKDLLVLHFTAGKTARSAFDTWRGDVQRVGTSYLVDVDGTIYEVFPPKFWASHLGIKGSKSIHDRRSIGIEIANVGPLQPSPADPSILNWWLPRTAGAPDFTTRFCTMAETDRYLAADFRGKGHFAAFPAAQLDAVATLVRALCDQFSIPATLPPAARRFESDVNAFSSYKGVCTHANFRQDKWDIGPAFPWDRLGL
jgi:N-acetyl-anhydromuramyl-L-alanine amidase AmpD